MVNIDLKQEKFNRNIDYLAGILWFSLGIYLLFTEYQFISAAYLCLGIFIPYNAWMHYSFLEIAELSSQIIDNLKKIVEYYESEDNKNE